MGWYGQGERWGGGGGNWYGHGTYQGFKPRPPRPSEYPHWTCSHCSKSDNKRFWKWCDHCSLHWQGAKEEEEEAQHTPVKPSTQAPKKPYSVPARDPRANARAKAGPWRTFTPNVEGADPDSAELTHTKLRLDSANKARAMMVVSGEAEVLAHLDSVITQLQEKLRELAPLDKITQARRLGDQFKAAQGKLRTAKIRLIRVRLEMKSAEDDFEAAKVKKCSLKEEWEAMDITLSEEDISDPNFGDGGDRISGEETDTMEDTQVVSPSSPTSSLTKPRKLSPGSMAPSFLGANQSTQESVTPIA